MIVKIIAYTAFITVVVIVSYQTGRNEGYEEASAQEYKRINDHIQKLNEQYTQALE
jgi:hypothetical protein